MSVTCAIVYVVSIASKTKKIIIIIIKEGKFC
jgi:hypothetical protein